jgi:hypothetical protein
MLLGCCHCGEEPPSESTPPSASESGSQSDDPSGIYIEDCQNGFCFGGIYPARVRLDIPGFGTPGVNQCAAYTGSYTIPNAGGGSVAYFSDEKILNINTGLNTIMTAGPNPASRFVISYSCGQGILGFSAITISIRWSITASSSPGALSSVRYEYFVIGSINCLLPLTLTRGAVSPGAGPCNGTWPATVTLTPV